MIHTVVRLMVLDNVDLVLLKLTFFASDDLVEVGLCHSKYVPAYVVSVGLFLNSILKAGME